LYDSSKISEDKAVGNGNVNVMTTKMRKLQFEILQKSGESLVVTHEDVKFVPDLWINLFSIGKALKNGFNLGNEVETIKLMKGKTVILFDRCLKSKNGFVAAIKMKAVLADIGATIVNPKKEKPKNSINVNNLHKILGHCGEASARLTGKALGYEVIGIFDTCEACSIGKAKQKNINRQWKGGSSVPGERLYVDIISIQGACFGGAKLWALVVNDFSGYCWSNFLRAKSELKERILDLVKELKNVKFLEEFELCLMMLVLKAIFAKVYGLNG
jgi:hypothetical protein